MADYEGETGPNAYSQGLEHQNGLKNIDESNLYGSTAQSRRKVDFKMDFLKNLKYPLERQNDEGVRVKCSKGDINT